MPEAERMIGEIIGEYHGERDEKVQLCVMRYDEIAIPDFQRERKLKKIQKIAAEADRTAYIFPIVAEYGKKFYCLDGQQRLEAWDKNCQELVTVLLITGIHSRKRLGQLFLFYNRDRNLLNAFEKFVGALGAEDKGTQDIQRICGEYDTEVATAANSNGKVPAGAVTAIHEKGGNELLDRVLYIKTHAWGEVFAREANEATTLKGLATFVWRYREKLDDDRIIELLKGMHPGYILGAVNPARGVSRTASYSEFLREEYNRGLKGKARL
jgi:hypothetical protein